MKSLLSALVLGISCAATATPDVSDVSMNAAAGKRVSISYTLTGEPAVITFDVVTNGISIGRDRIRSYSGDVAVRVEADGRRHQIVWDSAADFPGGVFRDARAVVTAWPTNSPPNYMVVELETGDVKYYAGEEDLPFAGGVTNDLCKTSCIVMRKIPARGVVWTMGAEAYEARLLGADGVNENATREIPHRVVLTDDFYLGVFEVTARQWMNVVGNISDVYSSRQNMKSAVAGPWFECIRGATADYDWPKNGHDVDENGFLGLLRKMVPSVLFDLPTEAEWEFACRAGTQTAFNSGKNISDKDHPDVEFNEVGWYYNNSLDESGNKRFYPVEVGQKLPNAWGLYDMHGNVGEWCLDWYVEGDDYRTTFANDPGAPCVNPKGPEAGEKRALRGGGINAAVRTERSAARSSGAPTKPSSLSYQVGFRLWAPANAK